LVRCFAVFFALPLCAQRRAGARRLTMLQPRDIGDRHRHRNDDGYVRQTFRLPSAEARKAARFLARIRRRPTPRASITGKHFDEENEFTMRILRNIRGFAASEMHLLFFYAFSNLPRRCAAARLRSLPSGSRDSAVGTAHPNCLDRAP
jgi:hypothetical protein